jgi:hypothetical protein
VLAEAGDRTSGIDWCPGLRLWLIVCALSSVSGLSSSAVVFSRAKYRKHAEAKKLQNQTGFGKYTEDDDEDYEDVFGEPITTCELAGRYLSVLGACGTDSAFLQPPSILCRLCN